MIKQVPMIIVDTDSVAAILNQHQLTGGESHACEELDEQTRYYDR